MRGMIRIGVATIAVLLGTAILFSGGAVSAQESDPYVGGSVPSSVPELPPMGDAKVEGVQAVRSTTAAPQVESATHAFTGGDVLTLTLIGGAAIVAGVAVLGVRRRSVTTD